jgi:homoserine dehydrogenase
METETFMTQEIFIIQIGVGGIGSTLLRQLMQQQDALQQRYGFKLGYLALVETSGAVHTGQMLSPATMQAVLDARQNRVPLAELEGGCSPCAWQTFLPDAPCIIVDVTAADGLEESMVAAVNAGHRLVFANKRPLSKSLDVFKTLTATGATRYEATVGAGLPVLDTLQRLLDSGDKMVRIEAAMSGTLGYLCGALEEDIPLSQAVHTAKSNGWTEPDPRDDLSGSDVARKALILARTCGMSWEIDDIPAEPWFPPELADLSVAAFMARLPELDSTFAERVAQARTRSMALRYVATVEPDGASVGLRELPLDHPLAGLRGPDNMIVFTTERYQEPVPRMVIRGPGAGLDVTAAGVFGDIIATAREM